MTLHKPGKSGRIAFRYEIANQLLIRLALAGAGRQGRYAGTEECCPPVLPPHRSGLLTGFGTHNIVPNRRGCEHGDFRFIRKIRPFSLRDFAVTKERINRFKPGRPCKKLGQKTVL